MNITDHKLVTNLLGTLNNKNKIFVHCCKNESKMKICAIAKIQKTVRVLAIISSQQTLRKLWNMSLSHVLEQVVEEYVVIGQYLKDDKFSKHAHPFLSASDRIRIHNSLFHKWTLNHLAKLAFSHSQLKTVQELSKKEWNHALWD